MFVPASNRWSQSIVLFVARISFLYVKNKCEGNARKNFTAFHVTQAILILCKSPGMN